MKKKIYQEVKDYIESFNYELLSTEYINNSTDLDIKCDKGHVYKAPFGRFQQGKRCPHCNGGVAKWTKKMIKDHIEDNGYKFIKFVEFNKYDSRILIQCPNGHEPYEVLFGNFYRGKRCEKCSRSKWDEEKIINYVESEGYKFIRFIKYDKVLSVIEIECIKNHKHEMVFKKFLEGRRCPRCCESKGEKMIEKILNSLNIEYIQQYKFDGCELKRRLPFDFYLPKYNCCIEFDGTQHYYISDFFGGLDKFISTVISDTVKNEYCKKNNIKLIRIPYHKINNIEEIIVDELRLK